MKNAFFINFSTTIILLRLFRLRERKSHLRYTFFLTLLKDWSKKMHVITGIAATALAIAQPLIAFVRPGPNSSARPTFNWLHWFVGMSAWTFACKRNVIRLCNKICIDRFFSAILMYQLYLYIQINLLDFAYSHKDNV